MDMREAGLRYKIAGTVNELSMGCEGTSVVMGKTSQFLASVIYLVDVGATYGNSKNQWKDTLDGVCFGS